MEHAKITPINPEVHPPDRKTSESLTVGAMTLDQLTQALSQELNNVSDLESLMKNIEGKFLTPEFLEQITDLKTLAFVYDILRARKRDAQHFLMKMLELGMKGRLLSKLIDGTGPAPVGKKVPPQTKQLIDLRAELRALIDNKQLNGGQSAA